MSFLINKSPVICNRIQVTLFTNEQRRILARRGERVFLLGEAKKAH
jgi:hypothetical protein